MKICTLIDNYFEELIDIYIYIYIYIHTHTHREGERERERAMKSVWLCIENTEIVTNIRSFSSSCHLFNDVTLLFKMYSFNCKGNKQMITSSDHKGKRTGKKCNSYWKQSKP